jgi:hypothetical protein
MSGRIAALGEIARAVGAPEHANAGLLVVALVGICFTLTQLVLLRRQLKLDTLIKIIDSNRAIVSVGIEHPQIWPNIGANEWDAVHGQAEARRHYLQLWINHMQLMWGAWRQGVVSREEWNAYRADMADLLQLPALSQLMDLRRLGKKSRSVGKGCPQMGQLVLAGSTKDGP